MRKTIFIIITVVGVLILSYFIYWKLPISITHHSDIKFGNSLIENITAYKDSTGHLPKNSEWHTLKKLGFKVKEVGTIPDYTSNSNGNYEITFIEGFDGPYLSWNSIDKSWGIRFPKIFANNRVENDLTKIESLLSDTLNLKGKYVLFLRPSDKKFEDLKEEPGIYEADSDFGFGINSTIDSLENNPKYHNIGNNITTQRFIKIEGCKNCPKVIDRDSILYGLILTEPNKEIEVIRNIHSMPYLAEIDEYFEIKSR